MRLIDFFDRAAAQHPERPFLVQDAVQRSYRESWEATHRVALALQREVNSASRVGVYSANHYRSIEALYGTLRAGATQVLVNARNSLQENILFLQDAGVDFLFIHSQFAKSVRQILRECPRVSRVVCLDGMIDGAVTYDDWIAEPGAVAGEVIQSPNDPWAIYSTSGTTGRAKCVVHTHLTGAVAVVDMLHSLRLQIPARHLVVAPVSHFAGIILFALTAVGSTHLIMDRTNPEEILAVIDRERIEVLFLPPTLIYMLLASPRLADTRFSNLKALICCGAPIAPEKLREAINVIGPVMLNFFAQSEAIGPITALRPEDYVGVEGSTLDWRLRSIGRASLMRQVEVMSDDGSLLPPGVMGEIVVRSWGTTPGYVLADGDVGFDKELYAQGWLHTGDVGMKNEDGYIVLVDRKRDLIISGGLNVFPAEVEQALQSHPAVLDVIVIGVPDDKWGEAVKAVIQLKPDAEVSADDLIALCKKRIGSVKAPKSVEFWPDLPRSATGKLLKRVVRDKFWRGRARQI